jgi:hypothetical protein
MVPSAAPLQLTFVELAVTAGKALTVTAVGEEVAEHPLLLVTITV